MPDRRRFPRFAFLAPIDAHLRTVADCLVESWDDDRAVVVTTDTALQGDVVVMQLSSPSGDMATHTVRVISSTPVEGEGTTRFRLHVSVDPRLLTGYAIPNPTL